MDEGTPLTQAITDLSSRVGSLEAKVERLSGAHVHLVAGEVSASGEIKQEPHAEIVAAEGPPPGLSVTQWISGLTGSPGIVVDEQKAFSTPCLRTELGEGRHPLVWSEGIIGALDAEQQTHYCQQGYLERPITPKQQARLAAMERAAKLCSVEAQGFDITDRLHSYFHCLGRELKGKGEEAY